MGTQGEFDLIIGSDLTYSEQLTRLDRKLLLTLLQLADNKTDVILAHTCRADTQLGEWRSHFERYFSIVTLHSEECQSAGSRDSQSPPDDCKDGSKPSSIDEDLDIDAFSVPLRLRASVG